MNRRGILLVAIGLVLAASQGAAANEAERLFQRALWWEGTWDVEATEGDETTQVEMVISRHTGHSLLVTGPQGSSLWGYDANRKRWVGVGFQADGGSFQDVTEPFQTDRIGPDSVDKSTREMWQADGTKVIGEQTWTCKDENTAVIRQVRKSEDGESLSDIVFTCRRRTT